MGEESPCYSKLNCKGISPHGSLTSKSALNKEKRFASIYYRGGGGGVRRELDTMRL
jgi:hypothetical protein